MRKRPAWLWIVLILWLAALAALAAWLWLRGGRDDPPPLTNQVAPKQASDGPIPPAKALPQSEQLALAFRAAFGSDREARRTVGENSYVYTPERLEWVGNRAMLISLGRNPDDCHACSGAMAIHYLLPEGDGLRVSGAWLDVGPGGGWGNPAGEVAVNRDLTENPVIYSETTDGGQGYMCTVAWLVELQPGRPVSSEPFPIGSSNAGAVLDNGRTMTGDPLREIEGRIGNVRRGQAFDVIFTGAERFSETYHYRNGRFVGPAQSRAAC